MSYFFKITNENGSKIIMIEKPIIGVMPINYTNPTPLWYLELYDSNNVDKYYTSYNYDSISIINNVIQDIFNAMKNGENYIDVDLMLELNKNKINESEDKKE